MTYFKDGYNGEDLFILRNSKTFHFNEFFIIPSGYLLVFQFKVNNIYLWGHYENISLDNEGHLRAHPFTHSTEKQLSCFEMVVIVYDESGAQVETYYITVNIHVSISNAWLTPNPITLRSNINNVAYSLYVRFDDGMIYDASLYPDLVWGADTGTPSFITIDSVSGRINADSSHIDYPTTFPFDYPNCVKVTFPTYLNYTSQPSGTIKILSSSTTVTLYSGDVSRINTNMNVLILGDGFLDTQSSIFTKYAGQVVDAFNSNIFKPWNLFSDKINYWFCSINSAEEGGALMDMHIKLHTATDTKYVSYGTFINICDKCIFKNLTTLPFTSTTMTNIRAMVYYLSPSLDYTIDNTIGYPSPPSSSPPLHALPSNSEKVSGLISNFGLPGKGDFGKTMSVRTAEWDAICNNTQVYNSIGTLVLSDFIFKLWMLLYDRIIYSKPDTAFGTYRKNTPPDMNVDKGKFINKIQFNKFIHGLASGSIPIGSYFFDSDGIPLIKDGNNVLTAVRMQNTVLYGIHTEDKPKGYNVFFNIHGQDIVDSDGITSTSGIIFPSLTTLPVDVAYERRATAVHEFSHNYVDDEYFEGTAKTYTPAVDADLRLNLQGESSLIASGIINGNKIKWAWPRIKKIGINTSGLAYEILPITYKFTMGDVAPANIALVDPVFAPLENIILRKKKLSDTTEYPQFKILSIDFATGEYIVQYLGATPISLADYGPGSLVIGPHWNTDGITYPDLVFSDIKTRMGRDVMATIDSGKNEPQQPKSISIPGYSDPVQNLRIPADKGRIIGLWAGGRREYDQRVYHASGFCIMRGTSTNFLSDIGDVDSAQGASGNYFCPVCRYILVDNIDPLKHPSIDKNYENIYPKY